ncbi:TonB-dependent receptor family protein [Massilia niastensis]|uniref:TonB-dependent receptor family protein n=1 Tax=Massilia niastensis TaxID=544911 RepID=UPI0004758D67|nr:TonB-dependent receptor [Massilia niastensis]
MNFAAVPRSAPAFKPLALACALSLSAVAAQALAQDSLPSVFITGARFPATAVQAPIGATVITAEQIRSAGATDVNQAIRKIGGVFGRQSLDASPDFALDLRGFGSNSAQNLVIMVDGVRLNENELANASLSSIPVDTVERIEITRGGSSVLYGEGATGGVIHIITGRAGKAGKPGTRGSVFLEAGRFDQHDLRASLAHGAGPWSFDAAVADRGSDGFRDNSEYKQKTASAGVQYAYAPNARAGVRVESARSDSQFPGSLTEAQFLADPRQTRTPRDFGTLDTDRVSAFVEQRVGAFDLAAELSHRRRDLTANYFFQGAGGETLSRLAYEAKQTQFSPRLRHAMELGDKRNELVAGIDLIRWDRATTSDFSLGDARQDSKAIYVRDELRWNAPHNARLALGARHEKFDKDYADPLAFPPVVDESRSQSLNAWSLEGSIDVLPQVTLFAKAGRSYRVANVDENSLRSGPELIEPQTSRDLELGLTAGDAARQATARLFRHRLRNEIFYDPTIGWGANTNLDPTRRQGVEVEGHATFARSWRVTGQWQYVQAEFTDGPNAGRDMVLVPKHVLTARLAWAPGNGHSADIGAQWVDRQRNGGDFDNSCSTRIPSFTTIDARYARRIGPWEIAASALNLADRQYYSNAFGCRSGIYPSDGRQLKLSLRYDF